MKNFLHEMQRELQLKEARISMSIFEGNSENPRMMSRSGKAVGRGLGDFVSLLVDKGLPASSFGAPISVCACGSELCTAKAYPD